jgi:hypothetical protein
MKGTEMDSVWQAELLALVTRYGEQCAQLAVERARGICGHPPANRAAAWAALLSHLAKEPQQRKAAEPALERT